MLGLIRVVRFEAIIVVGIAVVAIATIAAVAAISASTTIASVAALAAVIEAVGASAAIAVGVAVISVSVAVEIALLVAPSTGGAASAASVVLISSISTVATATTGRLARVISILIEVTGKAVRVIESIEVLTETATLERRLYVRIQIRVHVVNVRLAVLARVRGNVLPRLCYVIDTRIASFHSHFVLGPFQTFLGFWVLFWIHLVSDGHFLLEGPFEACLVVECGLLSDWEAERAIDRIGPGLHLHQFLFPFQLLLFFLNDIIDHIFVLLADGGQFAYFFY